ncbi:unnamed protein product [Linum tenue]|uniref:Protein EXORDIUM-like 2 n=1 Tax=Linum tenue TaxID=586396 RepID=A0AAV0H9N6_9ROSI|nr:unnamed protein product [Linum tenue]
MAPSPHLRTSCCLLPFFFVLFFFFFLSFSPQVCTGEGETPPEITYHNGPILTGNVKLALVWYGRFGRVQKNTVRAFVKSLNYEGHAAGQPLVSSWWKIVEGYQTAAKKPDGPITVKVARQVTDTSYSIGKVITTDFLKPLIQKATEGNPGILPVIFTARDVSVHGLCMGKCADHGIIDNQAYVIVGNPETECPEECAWPFRGGPDLIPPSGDIGADAMVIGFAQGLVAVVTNPQDTGFFEDSLRKPLEASSACTGIFGSGAVPGSNPGKLLKDPATGKSFNCYGSKGKRFLVPAVWNPATKTCWTLM